jgi:hypothetical protein
MIFKAAREMNLNLSGSWLIGDAPRDIEAGKAAGCRTILFLDPSLPKSPATQSSSFVSADHSVTMLKHALDIIEASEQATGRPGDGANPTTNGLNHSQLATRNPQLLEQILVELRRRNESSPADFSVSKLLAGIVQVLVLAVLFFAYIHRGNSTQNILLVALTLQAMTIALLIMGRQR